MRQANIKTKNHFMDFYDSSWQYFPDTGISTGSYIVFYQGGKIDHGKHVPGTVAQSSSESEYSAAWTTGMALAHFRMLIHEFLNKDPDIVPEEAHLIVLYIKYAICMAKNVKDTKNKKHIERIMHLVRNGEKWNMHNIDWCEGGLQLEDISSNNVVETDLTSRMK